MEIRTSRQRSMNKQVSRSLTAVGIAAVLIVGVGGFAYGATGGSFLLGKSNKAGGSTSLTNTGSGVALKLFTKSSLSAPFSTNAKGKVANLYADKANTANTAANSTKLGGQTLSQVIASARPAALTCAQGGVCAVGDTGPGNGKVFYDAGSMQSWGRYLEAAPNTWSGGTADPTLPWCVGGVDPLASVPGGAPGTAIGMGWPNTERIARYCDSGAAVAARGYHGGGKADWFLPSRDELAALLPARNSVSGLSPSFYWSSSQWDGFPADAWEINVGGAWDGFTVLKSSSTEVRPIRAF